MALSIILLIVLIIINGFFSGSEIAFISINENKLKDKAEKGNKKASLVLKLKEKPNKFLSTIQIGVSIASILSGVFASEAFASSLAMGLENIIDLPLSTIKSIAMLVISLITSFFMLLFGELVPKRLAMAKAETFAFFAIYPLTFLEIISRPLVSLLSFSTNLILTLLGIDPDKIKEEISEEEIRLMVESGKIGLLEKEMIEKVFQFDDVKVKEIMTPRTDIVAINHDDRLEDIVDLINSEIYSRYPVYKESIDNIIGIIHLREILRCMTKADEKEFLIDNLIKEPYFIPLSKSGDELFKELQSRKEHMAIVIDEYGGTAGMVTMEDLIEEIMGDILDEYDFIEDDLVKLSDNTFILAGSCELKEVEDLLDIELPTNDYTSLGGFLIGKIGEIPKEKELKEKSFGFSYNGYRFTLLEMEGKAVSRVKIKKED